MIADMPFSYQEFFHRQIEEMSQLFQQRMNLVKDRFGAPRWMDEFPPAKKPPGQPADPLSAVCRDVGLLYERGQIVYGMLVQAHDTLFRRLPPWNAPAAVLYSVDSHYHSYPSELSRLAEELYSYKGMDDAPEELRTITDAITSESPCLFNAKLPTERAHGRQIYFTTLMVHREHLPRRRICGTLLPLLCAPDHTDACVILPCRYWTSDFIRLCW